MHVFAICRGEGNVMWWLTRQGDLGGSREAEAAVTVAVPISKHVHLPQAPQFTKSAHLRSGKRRQLVQMPMQFINEANSYELNAKQGDGEGNCR